MVEYLFQYGFISVHMLAVHSSLENNCGAKLLESAWFCVMESDLNHSGLSGRQVMGRKKTLKSNSIQDKPFFSIQEVFIECFLYYGLWYNEVLAVHNSPHSDCVSWLGCCKIRIRDCFSICNFYVLVTLWTLWNWWLHVLSVLLTLVNGQTILRALRHGRTTLQM